jgi:hypothetical protein
MKTSPLAFLAPALCLVGAATLGTAQIERLPDLPEDTLRWVMGELQ